MERLYRRLCPYAVVVAALLGSCADQGPDPIDPGVNCSSSTAISLAPGESIVLNATVNAGCIRIPAASAGGARHLVVAYSAAGNETQNGVAGPYSLNGRSVASASPPAAVAGARRVRAPNPAADFHAMLRTREAELSRDPSRRPSLSRVRIRRPPPVVGSQDTFKVCGNTSCTAGTFVNVAATARYVGPRGAIYLDNTVPAGGLTQADIDSLGSLFDGASPNLYETDTTAFGRESDQDGNGVVIILLTDQVNKLSGTCPGGSIILGYFFGLDLITDPNSNGGEIFYSLVPNPAGPNCAVDRDFVFGNLPQVLIHELQHMISFNQHALIRSSPAEQTWLNEGLSHFAEELGGRVLPDSRCPLFSSCLTQFARGNLINGGEYFLSIPSHFLVYPGSSFGTLEERGASWLFVRWLADHEASDTLLGTDLTRALLMTTQVGAANVNGVTGQAFDQLVGQWQMANYAEQLASFTDGTGRLRYRTWDLNAVLTGIFGQYPLNMDSTSTGAYTNGGTLRAGSGKHLLVIQNANAPAVDLQLKGDGSFASLVPRFAVVRIQ